MGVAEMRMLRWMCGLMRKDKIRNEDIRGKVGVAEIEGKMRENRLRWVGHVQRRPTDAPVRRCDYGTKVQGRRGRGRPRKTLEETIRKDIERRCWPSTEPSIGEGRPEEVETFFRLLEEANQDLWPGCKEFKKLEAVHTAEHMKWHAIECPKDEFMRHPSDSPALKHLDNLYPDFTSEIRNVRLGLASDGFNPFGKMRNDHSTWPVVLSVYNLSPWMCMKQPNLLLSLLIPGRHSPGKEIDVYMRPLIDELNKLWEDGVHMAIKPVHIACMIKNLFTCRSYSRLQYAQFCLKLLLWYLQTLKRYVRNKGRPEGSIDEAYLVDECLSFCSMYLRGVESRRTRRGRNEDGENVELDLNVLDQCHRYILNNCEEVNPFRSQHEEFLKTKHRREMLTMRQIKELSKKEFPEWFKQHMNSSYHANDTLISQDLHWLANYPSRVVSRYKSHIVHGFRFRIKSVDDKHKNQNCGVFVPANVPGAIGQVNCYGRVVDMFEVKYCGPTEAGDRGRAVMLFKCEWVNSESPRGWKTDQYGFTMVNFNQLGFKEDPFILASQALQAFYVEDTIEKDWHVVVRTQPRDLFDVLEDSDAIDDYAIPNLDDRILDNKNFHTRVGMEETHFLESLALPTEFVNHAHCSKNPRLAPPRPQPTALINA
ncbi:unnamed protein product [Malus baccata var. baccata]